MSRTQRWSDTARPCRKLSEITIGNVPVKTVCIIGASGKLGRYMIQHCLDRGYSVRGVCRASSVDKLSSFKNLITIFPGNTNDRDVVNIAVAGCDGVLTVLVPWGRRHYAAGTAQAVLDFSKPDARLVFSCGWHIMRDDQDKISRTLKWQERAARWIGTMTRLIDIDDQIEACRRVFASERQWTVVRGSDLEEGESQGMPVWSKHVGDPLLESNITRRVDYALFMVAALESDALIQQAPAIVSCAAPSARARRWEEAG